MECNCRKFIGLGVLNFVRSAFISYDNDVQRHNGPRTGYMHKNDGMEWVGEGVRVKARGS